MAGTILLSILNFRFSHVNGTYSRSWPPPFFTLFILNLYKADITLSAAPKGVHLRKSWLNYQLPHCTSRDGPHLSLLPLFWLSIRRTLLLEGHIVPLPKVSVLERVHYRYKGLYGRGNIKIAITVKPLWYRHQRDRTKCPLYRGVHIIEVGNVWFLVFQTVRNKEVSAS